MWLLKAGNKVHKTPTIFTELCSWSKDTSTHCWIRPLKTSLEESSLELGTWWGITIAKLITTDTSIKVLKMNSRTIYLTLTIWILTVLLPQKMTLLLGFIMLPNQDSFQSTMRFIKFDSLFIRIEYWVWADYFNFFHCCCFINK